MDDDAEGMRAEIAKLQRALESCSIIGQAVGILAERYALSVDQARATLVRFSGAREVELLEVATCLVETGQFDRGDTSPRASCGLSGREREVLALIAGGHSNDEIAKILYLGINTVKTYIRTTYRKIGAARRAQAVIWAYEHGLGPGGSSSETGRIEPY